MKIIRLLAYGVVLGLSVSGCGKSGADKSVLGYEAKQAELGEHVTDSSAEFDSLAATQNIDVSFASGPCTTEGCTDAAAAKVPAVIAEPIPTVDTRPAEPVVPEADQKLALEPVNPEEEAIVRDALYTLGDERCAADGESGPECPAKPEPGDQLKF
ncbi:hypothetical protein [Pseudomonas sp. OIL-1]|uniref:hypothetical protein n=1 Tax=Pseudomonas sp. OIL-1 TaxID=2706126 RepID=UPI0013A7ADC3|nr:hypothetical protein [Pseudomonas sp. OIL-1]QIB49964.1 hypothetical protein G3M63_02120 [Pseudomonas sp. OIL-1]